MHSQNVRVVLVFDFAETVHLRNLRLLQQSSHLHLDSSGCKSPKEADHF